MYSTSESEEEARSNQLTQPTSHCPSSASRHSSDSDVENTPRQRQPQVQTKKSKHRSLPFQGRVLSSENIRHKKTKQYQPEAANGTDCEESSGNEPTLPQFQQEIADTAETSKFMKGS